MLRSSHATELIATSTGVTEIFCIGIHDIKYWTCMRRCQKIVMNQRRMTRLLRLLLGSVEKSCVANRAYFTRLYHTEMSKIGRGHYLRGRRLWCWILEKPYRLPSFVGRHKTLDLVPTHLRKSQLQRLRLHLW